MGRSDEVGGSGRPGLMSLAVVAGRRYGPVAFHADGRVVTAFVTATGDDAARWSAAAPPPIASAALFAVAPQFLEDPDVVSTAGSVIHTDQEFVWHRALPIGSELSVEGEVTSVRERRGVSLVAFGLRAEAPEGHWLDGSATFLISGRAAAPAVGESEPPHDLRAEDRPAGPAAATRREDEVLEVLRSASRADLVRYAAASGDWNPIHWDHRAAVEAGLPGVVCHGLLMAAWMAQVAAHYRGGDHPLASLRLRFRRPLRPAAQARITALRGEDGDLDLTLYAGENVAVAGAARVTA